MKKLKNFLAFVLYRQVMLLAKLVPAKTGRKHLLLIKTDEIGDYILFRNFFRYFRANRFEGYKITLIGTASWKALVDEYDQSCFDNVIWLDKKKFKSDLSYRFSFLKQVRQLKTSDVVNCVFSRSLNLDDGLAFVATGNNKIAMKSDDSNRSGSSLNLDRLIYTEIIGEGDVRIFDSERNRNFVEQVVQMQSIPATTKLQIQPRYGVPADNYFVLFIGAGNPERRWPIEYFVEVTKYTAEKYSLVPMVCGGPGDNVDADRFMELYNGHALNYTGKTTLPMMMELLSRSKFLISVDTGAVHMAAAVGCPVVGLYSGKYYGRFAPYPHDVATRFYPVYPDFVDELIAKNDPILYDTAIMKNNTMKMIPAKKVLGLVDKAMN